MTVTRMVVMLAALSAVGLAVVGLRVDKARHTRRVEEMQAQRTQLRQRLWQQETIIARLRSPQSIRERAARLGVAPELSPAAEPAADRR